MSIHNSQAHRAFLRRSLAGLGGLTLGIPTLGIPTLGGLTQSHAGNGTVSAMSDVGRGNEPAVPHHRPRARRVIFLFMHGGPSQVDTFDYKPQLQRDDGGTLPFEAADNIDAVPKLLKSPWKFAQHGECGQWVSELLPHTAEHVDDLCVIRSMHSRGQSHGQAVSMMHTGSDNLVRPSVGAWVSYGLGTGNPDLPAFVSIGPASGHGGPRNYGSAFLPAMHQATVIGQSGKLGEAKIDFLGNDGIAPEEQAEQLALLRSMDQRHLAHSGRDPRIQGAIDAAQLAFRMQAAAPEVLDVERETADTRRMYGIGEKSTDNFGRQCLLARRLVESGVRYVELSTGNVWDQHSNLVGGHEKNALATDRPIAALLTDLKQRGLLEDTLVVWGGEFGRTPIVQGSNGRDHNPQGFTVWLAGGGVRGGMAWGETDEYGYYAVENRVHVHDLHATLLHLLGLDHEDLTYRYAGRDFRLTDVYGKVVQSILRDRDSVS